MDLMANMLLSAGASPAMIHSVTKIPDFTPVVQGLCVNLGTLSYEWLPSMKAGAKIAREMAKPWVLDPVAAGASGFRLRACLELVEMRPTVIRGNGSEVMALAKAAVGSCKGADICVESTDALEAAKALAKSSGAVVAVSGVVDIVTDGERVVGAKNGVPMLQRITATGCSVTALITAFVAIDPQNPLEATASALAVFGVAAEMGMKMAKGPASIEEQ
uniref:hydroxyethylthiazole kinase n=1 Tax=Kalanchoe fedtschenkoi TaxID=63787 RepID=A0A7N0USG3_KALFE